MASNPESLTPDAALLELGNHKTKGDPCVSALLDAADTHLPPVMAEHELSEWIKGHKAEYLLAEMATALRASLDREREMQADLASTEATVKFLQGECASRQTEIELLKIATASTEAEAWELAWDAGMEYATAVHHDTGAHAMPPDCQASLAAYRACQSKDGRT